MMTDDDSSFAAETRNWLGQHLRTLRQARKLTLKDMVKRTGFAPSTLSKIENGQLAVTYDKLLLLARGLEIELSELLSEGQSATPNGRRSITRQGQGSIFQSPQYTYEMLGFDLANKKIIPLLTHVGMRDIEEFGPLTSHEGEEFFFVLKGRIEFHSEFYECAVLEPGDSAYFDSGMGHALTCKDGDGLILWVSTLALRPPPDIEVAPKASIKSRQMTPRKADRTSAKRVLKRPPKARH